MTWKIPLATTEACGGHFQMTINKTASYYYHPNIYDPLPINRRRLHTKEDINGSHKPFELTWQNQLIMMHLHDKDKALAQSVHKLDEKP